MDVAFLSGYEEGRTDGKIAKEGRQVTRWDGNKQTGGWERQVLDVVEEETDRQKDKT